MPSILIIDDRPDIRAYLRTVLEAGGHRVWEAGDGAEGLRLLQAEPPDLVFCDLFMPEQDGLETLRAIRRLRLEVPVVVMSGSLSGRPNSLLEVAQVMGAVAMLEKPIRPSSLLQAVETHALRPKEG